MNAILLVSVGIFLVYLILVLISPILSAISLLIMVGGLLVGNGYVAFGGLIGVLLFGRLALLAESKPTYVVNK